MTCRIAVWSAVIFATAFVTDTFAQSSAGGNAHTATTAPAVRVSTYQVTQVFVDLPSIEAWVDVRAADGTPVLGLQASSFRASVAGAPLIVRKVESMESVAQPTAYVLLVDVSGTMRAGRNKKSPFAAAIAAGEQLVEKLTPKDRMALVSFGDEVKLEVDFDKDRRALSTGLDALVPKAKTTHLFDAVKHALQMLRRIDPTFPKRRVIMLVSDGVDEGSGFTIDDLLRQTGELSVPVLAVGYSRVGRRGFGDLNRLAENSGGAFVESASPQEIEVAAAELHRRLSEAYAVELEWKDGIPDGGMKRVQLNLDHGAVFPGGRVAAMVSSRERVTPWYRDRSLQVGGGAGLLFVLGLMIVAFRRRSAEPTPHLEPSIAPGGTPSIDAAQDETAVVRLLLLRGDGQLEPPGPEYVVPKDGLVVGREGGLKIVGDSEVSALHCRILAIDGMAVVEDSGSRNGTRRNGIEIRGQERLDAGDVIKLGHTEVRFEGADEK